MKTEKNYNIQLLKIILMIMIVSLHFITYKNLFNGTSVDYNINNYFIYFIENLTVVSVNVFILITGYYMYNKKVKLKKTFSLALKVIVINYFILLLCLIIKPGLLNLKNLFFLILPIASQQYWFINAYIFLYLLIPFINTLTKNLDKKKFTILIVLLFVLNTIIPLFIQNAVSIKSGNDLVWFINLFLIGSYIKKFMIFDTIKKNVLNFIYLLSLAVIPVIAMVINNVLGKRIMQHFFTYNSPFVLLPSILLLLLFLNIKSQKNKIVKRSIDWFARYNIGVYIIHENILIRELIWNNLVTTPYFFNLTPVLNIIITSFIIYSICILLSIIPFKISDCLLSKIILLGKKYLTKEKKI